MPAWLPLESNPTVMNQFLKDMGMNDEWSVVDVYGIDAELLAMVPQPVAAVILLFPLTEKEEELRTKQEEEAKSSQVSTDNVYFMRQYVSNACGTVALLHALGNNLDTIKLSDGTLKNFFDKTKNMNPEERGLALENDEGVAQVHDNLAQEGQTSAPDRDSRLDTHFIAFVNVNNNLFELDGRKCSPIHHGITSTNSFLADSAKVCGEFMKREPQESRFAMVALAKSD